MFNAEVYISLKKTVADPQGLTIKHALDSLGYDQVGDVRIGKMVTLELKAKNKEQAEIELDQMCKKLLANPIIEEYRFKLEEVK